MLDIHVIHSCCLNWLIQVMFLSSTILEIYYYVFSIHWLSILNDLANPIFLKLIDCTETINYRTARIKQSSQANKVPLE